MDQCKNCILRGDIAKCKSTPCFQHENWYAQELVKEIEILRNDAKKPSTTPLTDEQADRLANAILKKLAEKSSDQYGALDASDLNPNIYEHHALRRSLVQAAYMAGWFKGNL